MSEPQDAPAQNSVATDREILQEAQSQGTGATLKAWVHLSGPGWLQSAITLGGGSLGGAIYMGILGGVNLLWLQLVAIICGVVMLSAISYVTLSTGKRPFQEINNHINPALGWGWIVTTCLANMIFCMPQFALCYAALTQNFFKGVIPDGDASKVGISLLLLGAAGGLVYLNSQQGLMAKIFDWVLKGMIGVIVICFFGVVVTLASSEGTFDWATVFAGFIPDLSAVSRPTGDMPKLVALAPENMQDFWSTQLVSKQRSAMIGAAATAVGINMTFLLPYSMLARGWDKPFRGLARFDLSTGMAIPYVIVTSCVVIASAAAFHGKADEKFLSNDFATMQESPLLSGKTSGATTSILEKRIEQEVGDAFKTMSADEKQTRIANLSNAEKVLAASLVTRDEFILSSTLAPFLGESNANLIFGLGIFGMGFSTIVILMMINGYAVCEMADTKPTGSTFVIGCLIAGISGASWIALWDGPSKAWLAILVSSFAILFLPIAYITFFLMMNSKRILGNEMPRGASRWIWNGLMSVAVIGAICAAATSFIDKVTGAGNPTQQLQQNTVITLVVLYVILVAVGFFFTKKHNSAEAESP